MLRRTPQSCRRSPDGWIKICLVLTDGNRLAACKASVDRLVVLFRGVKPIRTPQASLQLFGADHPDTTMANYHRPGRLSPVSRYKGTTTRDQQMLRTDQTYACMQATFDAELLPDLGQSASMNGHFTFPAPVHALVKEALPERPMLYIKSVNLWLSSPATSLCIRQQSCSSYSRDRAVLSCVITRECAIEAQDRIRRPC